MKKLNLVLKRCKTLSRQLGRTSSYSSLRSKSSAGDHQADDHMWGSAAHMVLAQDDREKRAASTNHEDCETVVVFVGSSRRRFLVKSKYLNHPLLKAIIQKSNKNPAGEDLSVKCEVVLFDHLLWMLDNADPNLASDTLSLEELADLYVF